MVNKYNRGTGKGAGILSSKELIKCSKGVKKMDANVWFTKTYSIFIVHQRKGGIHDIYRIFMGTFGWYRLTGLLHQNIWKTHTSVSGHQVYLVAFLFSPALFSPLFRAVLGMLKHWIIV